MAEFQQLSGLAQILSAEKMPRRAEVRGPYPIVEIENYIVRLENYLRRLFGRFTAENILNTIIDGGGGIITVMGWEVAHVKWYQIPAGKAAGTEYTIIDSDWRGRIIAADTLAGGSPEDTTAWQEGSGLFLTYKIGANYAADYVLSSGGFAGGGGYSVKLKAGTGKPTLEVDTSGNADPENLGVTLFAGPHRTTPEIVLT